MQSNNARDIHDDEHWRGAMDISHVIRHKPRPGSIQVQCTAVCDVAIVFGYISPLYPAPTITTYFGNYTGQGMVEIEY